MSELQELRRSAGTRLMGIGGVAAAAFSLFFAWMATASGGGRWLLWLQVGVVALALASLVWKWRTPLLCLAPWGFVWRPAPFLSREEVWYPSIGRWRSLGKAVHLTDRTGRTLKVDLSELEEEDRERFRARLVQELGEPEK